MTLKTLFTFFSVGLLLALSVSARAQPDFPRPYAERDDVAGYISEIVAQHGFDQAELRALFADAAQRQDIIERISRPAEKVWTWARYQRHLVDQDRIDRGVNFWNEHHELLAQAEQRYGVAPEYVVAILGIETRYGSITGNFRVLDALATLGFDYPPRSAFFRKELTEFLLLAREENKDPRTLLGSYAGAMGYGQFIPSSYRYYAVDFNGDGARDIWQDPADAIGSIANYFARHHWRGDSVVARRVSVSGSSADALANQGLTLKNTVADLRAAGVAVDLPADAKAALYKLEGASGDEYWVGLHDFYVITRYNHSHMYALAVYQLSQAIGAQRAAALANR